MTDTIENTEIEAENFEISDDEFRQISLDLDQYHAIFHKFWQIGKPIFTRSIPTACIRWDTDFHVACFEFNPDFWKSLDHYNRLWVIVHEMLHAILNHGIRMKDSKRKELVNTALDVVVNHMTVDRFAFDRSRIQNADNYCWVDTVFKDKTDKKIRENQHVEYYLRNLIEIYPEIKIPFNSGENGEQSSGDGESGENSESIPGTQTVDEHGKMADSDDFKEVFEEINSSMTNEEKKSIKDIIEKHYETDGDNNSKQNGSGRGISGTGVWTFMNVKNVQKKRKWETVIYDWCRKRVRPDIKGIERWGRVHRRLTAFKSKKLRLPCEMDVDTFVGKEYKLNLLFFLDVSGTCSHLAKRFFKAALSLPEDRFETELFAFNTAVQSVDKKTQRMSVGGGTSFHIIEAAIQKWKKEKNNDRYPDAVFIITDGKGNSINPEKPERIYWFLTESNSKSFIPSKSHTFELKDFE